METRFINMYMPKFLSNFLITSNSFNVEILNTYGGNEIRNITDYGSSRKRYHIKNCFLSASELNEIIEFWNITRGMLISFKLYNQLNKVENQILYKGSLGKKRKIQLFKLYKNSKYSYNQKVTSPIPHSITLKLNDKILSPNQWSLDQKAGIIHLNKNLRSEDILTGSFKFDNIVRFNTKELTYHLDANHNSFSINDLELIEAQ